MIYFRQIYLQEESYSNRFKSYESFSLFKWRNVTRDMDKKSIRFI